VARKILSIDGGGIRGVGPAHLLVKLDAALKAAGKPGVTDAFDLYVGTSTGCILAAGLAAYDLVPGAPLTPTDLLNLYYDRGAQMFVSATLAPISFGLGEGRYQTSKKNQVLQNIIGPIKLGQLNRNFLGTFFSLRPEPGPVFAQGGPRYRDIDKDNYRHLLLSDVVNASSNAPIYFDPSYVNGTEYFGVDGGVFANNPAVSAYVESRKIFSGDDVTVVSLGCGTTQTQFSKNDKWGLFEWAEPSAGIPIIEVILGSQASTVEHQMENLFEDGGYFRLQFSLDNFGPARIDDVSKGNLDNIVEAVDDYLDKHGGQATLDAIVQAL
jgi:patatin-like phospholipase/acyl hydrolase